VKQLDTEGNEECVDCTEFNVKCKTCFKNDGGDVVCASCVDTYYFDGSSQTCKGCDEQCETCTGTGPGSCIKCAETYAKDENTNLCGQTCPSAYYIKESERICDTCNSACSECFGKQINKCTSCNSGYFYKENGCYSCKESCDECLAPSEQLCIEC
jgi:proprotein convertase subtilisin/kexin type 5